MKTTAKPTHKGRRIAGTSLIELLVVIVVLLIGILGVIQVFPGGFGVLRQTKATTIMNEIAKRELIRIQAKPDQIPEEIRTTLYSFINSSLVSIVTVPSVGIRTLLPPGGDGMAVVGPPGAERACVFTNGQTDNWGDWQYLSGANLTRRIIGEGGRVPAPRLVGTDFGGLMVLQFGPITYNPAYPLLLQVYGNDMVKRWGVPGWGRSRPFIYYVNEAEEPSAEIIIPRDRFKDFDYRLEFTGWFNEGGNAVSRDVETTVTVNFDINGGFAAIPFSALPAVGSFGPLVGVDFDSVRLARAFEQVPNSGAFSGDPYEFVLMDPNLGVLLFNPRGYNYMEMRTNNRRVPLVARVNYDVFDWRIIRDEFRVPVSEPRLIKLSLDSIKVRGNFGPDGLQNRGMDVPVADGLGGTQLLDVIVVDLETGAVLLHDPTNPRDPNPPPGTVNDYLAVDPARSSYAVDKSRGFVRLLDYDRTASGLQVRAILPGATVPATLNADGRMFKAFYQGVGEFAVQAMKAPSRFRQTYGNPTVAEYYVGQSGASPYGQPTRIYFPGSDAGKNVTVGELWYTDGVNLKMLSAQNFQIVNAPFDPAGPYLDIRAVDPTAVAFDWSNGYAVRDVRGASVSVRVLWNPDTFYPTSTLTENWNRFVTWSRTWRQMKVETFLQKGENP